MPQCRGCMCYPCRLAQLLPSLSSSHTLLFLSFYCANLFLCHLCFFPLHSLSFKVFPCCLSFPLWLKISHSLLSPSPYPLTVFHSACFFFRLFLTFLSPLRHLPPFCPFFASNNTLITVRITFCKPAPLKQKARTEPHTNNQQNHFKKS